MLDLTALVDDVDMIAARLATKGVPESTTRAARDAVLARRSALTLLNDKRFLSNRLSRDVPRLSDSERVEVMSQLQELKREIQAGEVTVREATAQEQAHVMALPNLPSPNAPAGASEADNVVLRYEGPPAVRAAHARPHWDIASDLGLWDSVRAAKLSGSGFAMLRGDGARLLRALVNWTLDRYRDRYVELVVPHFVQREVMVGTGHLPKFADDAYNTTVDDLWVIPTGEVPLTGFHRDETLNVRDLPLAYMTYTSCFRREAGSAGKDTRGMQRLHEFHKVELVRLCRVEDAEPQLLLLLDHARETLDLLGLPYRVVDLCTGDLTFASARMFDLEVYAPGVDAWLEVSSVGDFSDFQARRSNIKVRDDHGSRVPVNTLNGSAVATPRIWAALLEHGWQEDGSVVLPDVLAPYLGGDPVLWPASRPRDPERTRVPAAP